jgi:TBC1 domain family member 2
MFPCGDMFLMGGQELVLFLQKLPTQDWNEKEVELVLSRAYMWRASFGNAQSHLQQ